MSIYRYDAFNRLTKYNSGSAEASYTYNANNLRASKTVNRETTNFVWNGQNLAAENKADTINTYTYDMTGVHIANRNGNVTSYLKDYHGNIVGTTTVAGAMVEEKTGQMDYDAFGNRWQGDTPDPFGYCGEYLDNESGLIYLRNRYYDSEIGRFITEDPIKNGLNWYAYCGNNPVILIDPSGLKLTASLDDSQTVLKQLQELTDDELDFEEEFDENGISTGMVRFVITKTHDTDRHVGQTLVSNLIKSDEVVNVNIDADPDGEVNKQWPASNDPDNIIQIYIDPDDTLGNGMNYTFVQNSIGDIVPEDFPLHIVFGHELVHAWREIHGMLGNGIELGVLPYDYMSCTPYDAEEAKTVGGNYLSPTGQQMQNYSTYYGIISENGLRIENGLNIRVSCKGGWR